MPMKNSNIRPALALLLSLLVAFASPVAVMAQGPCSVFR